MIPYTTHPKQDLCQDILVPDNSYKKCSTEDGSQYASSQLQMFITELKIQMQKLHAEYEMNVKDLHTELKTWKESSEVMRKYVDEVKTTLQYLKVMLK